LICEAARRLGFQQVGFAAVGGLDQEAADLRAWLGQGRHGSMAWMARRLAERADPRAYYPPAKTIVVLAMNYYTGPPVETTTATATATATANTPDAPRWSNYAWGDDYHRLLKRRLKALLAEVAAAFPQVNGIACVDTAPVMEKVWARRAGLGWQGKHTGLITRGWGSWVFLGELLLDAALEPDAPFTEDLCGSCTACLEACPTGALTATYQLDARRCISYLTIEHRGSFSREQAGWLNGWIYGCDLCQEVCPWNVRFARPSPETAFTQREFIAAFGWVDWAALGRERWGELLSGSAARRAAYEGLKRNVAAQAPPTAGIATTPDGVSQ